MPKVFLDLEKIKRPNSGLGQFGLHLSKNIIDQADEGFIGVYLPDEYFDEYKGVEKKQWKAIHKISKVSVNTSIWHSFHQEAVYFPKNKNIKLVLTIHDLNFLEKYKEAKKLKMLNSLQKLVSQSKALVFISNYTKNIAEENLKIPNNCITKVIYNGVAIDDKIQAIRPKWKNDLTPFLFTIGIIGEKKNFHVLVNMMKFLPDLKLYICGNKSSKYATEVEELIKKNKLESRVFLPGLVSESEKLWMYKNCSAFVFPSKNEGFGLPVVEAMSFGKPLVLSKMTSLPEIGGDESSYFNTFEAENMAAVVKETINHHSINKRDLLIKRASLFDWGKAAKEYLEIYKTLLIKS